MSFDDLNREVQTSGGNWVKLTKIEHGSLEGRVVDVEVRDKRFNDQPVVSSKTGKPRKEWVFTLDVDGEMKKFSANESAQFAIRGALGENKLEPHGLLKITVTADSVQGKKSAEYKAVYTPPKAGDAPAPAPEPTTAPTQDNDEPDF